MIIIKTKEVKIEVKNIKKENCYFTGNYRIYIREDGSIRIEKKDNILFNWKDNESNNHISNTIYKNYKNKDDFLEIIHVNHEYIYSYNKQLKDDILNIIESNKEDEEYFTTKYSDLILELMPEIVVYASKRLDYSEYNEQLTDMIEDVLRKNGVDINA